MVTEAPVLRLGAATPRQAEFGDAVMRASDREFLRTAVQRHETLVLDAPPGSRVVIRVLPPLSPDGDDVPVTPLAEPVKAVMQEDRRFRRDAALFREISKHDFKAPITMRRAAWAGFDAD